MIQMECVYITIQLERGHILVQKYGAGNGRYVAILFKMIADKGRCDFPSWGTLGCFAPSHLGWEIIRAILCFVLLSFSPLSLGKFSCCRPGSLVKVLRGQPLKKS